MPPFVKTLQTLALLLWNKGFAILVLVFLMYRFLTLSADPSKPSPFAELLYAAILIAAIIVVAPIIRFLVFPEVAEYAETGTLRRDLATPLMNEAGKPLISPALLHYWFATAISYLATALCIASLSH